MKITANDPIKMAKLARAATQELALLTTAHKNQILAAMAEALVENEKVLLAANFQDLAHAQKQQLNPALIDRLTVTSTRIHAMAEGLKTVSDLPDPINEILKTVIRPNGLLIKKIRVPIGVIAIIYEARPNVTADVTGLCLKAGNAVILRGGREAYHSNVAIYKILMKAGEQQGLPPYAVQLITDLDYNVVTQLIQLKNEIDCVIPRGGEKLINAILAESKIPVIKHYKGVCHVYVHANADLDMALNIIENAKCQRPGVCNAMETLLVDEAIAKSFLPKVAERLAPYAVELRGDLETRKTLPNIKLATEQDWEEEYLDLILAIRVVPNLEAAVQHINEYGSHHSDAIVSLDKAAAIYFTQTVDSAAVYVNASTRFTDGSEFGLGAEIGISTDKLHARGPMGLEELTTYKYVIQGAGQVRN